MYQSQQLVSFAFHPLNKLNATLSNPILINPQTLTSSLKKIPQTNNQSISSLNLGQFNKSKLSHLYLSTYEKNQKGKVLCLAYVENAKIKINQEAIQLFQKYNQKITFVGNLGEKASDKRFWYEKIFNLTQIQDGNYSSIQKKPGLYIWSIPFMKNNLHIFLIDFSSHSTAQNLSVDDTKLLDFNIILSQIMVLLPEPSDKNLRIVDSVYKNLNSCMIRLSEQSQKCRRQSQHWPRCLYVLYRQTMPVSAQADKLCYLFQQCRFSIIHNAINPYQYMLNPQTHLLQSTLNNTSILNNKYIKRTSLVFKDIHNKLKGKSYEGLQYTGQTIPFIMVQLAKQINSGTFGNERLAVKKVFRQAVKNIYQDKLYKCKKIYDLNTDDLIQKPVSIEKLIQNFKKTNKNTLNQFNKTKFDSKFHQQYQNKLIEYGDNQQIHIIKWNKQLTKQYLNKNFAKIDEKKLAQDKLSQKQIFTYIQQLKNTKKKLNHNRSDIVQQKLKDLFALIQKYKYLNTNSTENDNKYKQTQLSSIQKRKQLQKMNLSSTALQIQNYSNGQNFVQFDEKIQNLKSELDLTMRRNGKQITDYQTIQRLRQIKKKLQNQWKRNDQKLKSVRKPYTITKEPQILILEEKIKYRKQLSKQASEDLCYQQITKQLNTFTSIQNSNLQRKPIRKSQIRKIKQDNRRDQCCFRKKNHQ